MHFILLIFYLKQHGHLIVVLYLTLYLPLRVERMGKLKNIEDTIDSTLANRSNNGKIFNK